ncbi:dihydrofolate reductase family protein [Mycobacterium hubeiense]|uniref:dihydrofolate reductase family protein n=1 Tax=Mycobacterium hubeiense TaxID=1867256 RepID=UPI000C7EE296|nr:dihydrofolate reductase family protein [Mycobacterium sp. QGD 101]
MATIYFTAASLDGYIVDSKDSRDWLDARTIDSDGPFGITRFAQSVGALVMGATTYEWIVSNQPERWRYSQPTWVLTHRPQIVSPVLPVHVFSGDVTELHPKLLQEARYRDVWVVGGGQTAAQFAQAGLIDELIVTYAPCSLGAGGRLLPTSSQWKLIEAEANDDFVCARWRKV